MPSKLQGFQAALNSKQTPKSPGARLAAFGGVYGALGVDTQDILKLISESSIALAEVGAKFPTTA